MRSRLFCNISDNSIATFCINITCLAVAVENTQYFINVLKGKGLHLRTGILITFTIARTIRVNIKFYISDIGVFVIVSFIYFILKYTLHDFNLRLLKRRQDPIYKFVKFKFKSEYFNYTFLI